MPNTHPYEPLTSENAALVLIDHQVACPIPARAAAGCDVEDATLAVTGLPRLPEPPFRRAVPTTPADRTGARVDCFPAHAAFPNGRRIGIRIVTFEACSGFTPVTARRIAQPRTRVSMLKQMAPRARAASGACADRARRLPRAPGAGRRSGRPTAAWARRSRCTR